MSMIHEEVLAANQSYAADFGDKGKLPMPPARCFAILTCMDARLDPAKFAGLAEGDAHVIRNAGGRASDDGRLVAVPEAMEAGKVKQVRGLPAYQAERWWPLGGRDDISTGRSFRASLSSTLFTYLWPCSPPNILASSTASLITTRQGISGRNSSS